MKIDNEFTVGVPIDRAWAVLTDLEGIAPCMPGAVLTGVEGDVYAGKVKIKVGPITSEYAGTARFTERDEVNHRAVIDASGRDVRGAGNAAAAITAQLRAEGSSTVVSVDTDLKISGKIAQFGSGMIKEVSTKLLGQFVDCLEGKLAADVPVPSAPATATSAADGPAADGPAAEGPAAEGPAAEGPAATAESAPVGRAFTPSAEPAPLNLMSIAGSSVYKRLLPLVAVIVVIIAVIVYFALR